MIINITFTLIMLGLAIWDMRSFNTRNHKDFKSLMMSLGILGTFVGIFIGLLGFDTHNLLDSVPMLLEGLKTAFYTSIVGMGLAIALSIFQKARNKASVEEQSELEILTMQIRKLDELSNLKELNIISYMLKNIYTEVSKKQEFETHLKALLKDIDNTLHKALETLASGASKELIRALEIVISDFNNNLKEQFGDNFRQLNEATKNMLSWQENYKEHIESNTKAMEQMQESLKDSQNSVTSAVELMVAHRINLEEMRKYHEQNMSVQERLTKGLEGIESLESSLQERLRAISDLKDSSALALENSKHFIDSINQSKQDLESYFKDYDERSLELFAKNTQRISQSAKELQDSHTSTLEHIKDSHHIFKDTLSQANAQVLESFKSAAQHSSDLAIKTSEDMKSKSDSILSLSNDFKTSLDSMLGNLESTFDASNEALKQTLIQEYEHITAHINNLHHDLNDKALQSLNDIKEKILESSKISQENMESDLKHFMESTSACMDESIKASERMTQNHVESLQEMNKNNAEYVEQNLLSTKDFLSQTHSNNIQTLESIHTSSLQNLESTSTKAMENTIMNLEELQKSYRQNLESNLQNLNDTLAQKIDSLSKSASEALDIFNKALQTQHSKTTDSITEAMKNSSQYFIQTSGDFNDLLKGQYKRMNITFDRHTQDLNNFLNEQTQNLTQNLNTQSQNLAQSLEEQTQNLSESLNTQTQNLSNNIEKQNQTLNESLTTQSQNLVQSLEKQSQNIAKTIEEQTQNLAQNLTAQTHSLDENLSTKSEKLHEFLQTQTISLDTNLQQMLIKFNKMLEHNYINLSDMLEKDNELIIKSLDSQAVNISNNLLASHKKLDDFFYTAQEKFHTKVDSMMDKMQLSNAHISTSLGALSSEAKANLDSLNEKILSVYNENQKSYKQNLEHSFQASNALMQDMQSKSGEFYKNVESNLKSLESNLSSFTNIFDNFSSFNKNLESQFNNVMGKNSELLNSLEVKILSFDTTLKTFEEQSKDSFEGLNNNFKNLCIQYIKLMQASMQQNIKNQNIAATDFNKAITSIQESIQDLAQNSSSLFNAQKDMLNEITKNFKDNTDTLVKQGKTLQQNIGSSLETLDSKLEKMTKGFASNYEWFLKRIKEIMGG